VDDIQNSQFNCLLPPLLEGAKQYGLLYLAVKRCKGCRKILALWNAKASAGNNELRLDPTKLLLNYESWKVDADIT
jgi:hypothetical protein